MTWWSTAISHFLEMKALDVERCFHSSVILTRRFGWVQSPIFETLFPQELQGIHSSLVFGFCPAFVLTDSMVFLSSLFNVISFIFLSGTSQMLSLPLEDWNFTVVCFGVGPLSNLPWPVDGLFWLWTVVSFSSGKFSWIISLINFSLSFPWLSPEIPLPWMLDYFLDWCFDFIFFPRSVFCLIWGGG